MGIAISDDHLELRGVADAFLERTGARAEARALLDAPDETLPGTWKEMADLGWLGLHLPESHGGSGFGLAELTIVVEALGAAIAPGPFLPTVWASAVIAATGTDAQRAALLPGLADGSTRAAAGLDEASGLVLGAGLADLFLLPRGDDLVIAYRDEVTVTVPANTDATRRVGTVTLTATPTDHRVLPDARTTAVTLGRLLAAAEATGGAQMCVTMASEYAKVREQFGRVIGMFQAVKHQAADMFVATQLATAATWDAARTEPGTPEFELAVAVAATQALPAFVTCAEKNIQLHGGIGFTWEHDAHMILKRAISLAAVFGPIGAIEADVARLTDAGVVGAHAVELPPEAETYRAEVRAFIDRYRALPEGEQLGAFLDSGYALAHWPKPWGRAAGAVEQLVIDDEFKAAGVKRPEYGIGGWVIQTITQHANADQIERWIRPSLEHEYVWCQLFSEPGAGSDAAGIRTRATKTDGGWLVNGQKVWTSGAAFCNRGFATVRTDPDKPKHDGISMMVIDLHASGVDVRPLREASGGELFCEVFFDDVFVPDEDVVGPVNGGWKVARSTLGNERVSIGSGTGVGDAMFDLLDLVHRYASSDGRADPAALEAVGRLLAERRAMRLLNLRSAERAVAGAEPGPEGNVAKLLSGEHTQRVAALGLRLIGPAGALAEGPDAGVQATEIFARCLTIAGGTSEIVRSTIGERLLGLPRDPLLR
jgi:alkylation response protein AidB-like acyl-CoA dehydrogenase